MSVAIAVNSHWYALQTHDLEGYPLVLCDNCPRSYHLNCLGVTWSDLPEDEWLCPRCVEKKEKGAKRAADQALRHQLHAE